MSEQESHERVEDEHAGNSHGQNLDPAELQRLKHARLVLDLLSKRDVHVDLQNGLVGRTYGLDPVRVIVPQFVILRLIFF